MIGSNIPEKITKLALIFKIPGEISDIRVITEGHINDTYRVSFRTAANLTEYIFQRINTYVFRNPDSVMRNIGLVTEHIRNKNAGRIFSERSFLSFLSAADGKNYACIRPCEEDEYWRVCSFIDNTCDAVDKCEQGLLRTVGNAFGKFLCDLSELPTTEFTVTIPDFHNTRSRLDTMFAHVSEDSLSRCKNAPDVIETLTKYRSFGCTLCDMTARGELPLRIVHNDTKANNVLIDRDSLEPLAVIDLDTVMPGLICHDFGEAVRTGACTAAEDEPDTSKIKLDLDLYKAFAEGFIGELSSILTTAERNTMVLGAPIMTLENASRFMDDYITGDHYYKVDYPEHNLVRARAQLALFDDMMKKLPETERIIAEITD